MILFGQYISHCIADICEAVIAIFLVCNSYLFEVVSSVQCCFFFKHFAGKYNAGDTTYFTCFHFYSRTDMLHFVCNIDLLQVVK